MTNARYVEIPDVGHFVHIEANEQFRSIVGDFLT
jgi:pimeloyl-ACP methyl ester carboxylesterase